MRWMLDLLDARVRLAPHPVRLTLKAMHSSPMASQAVRLGGVS